MKLVHTLSLALVIAAAGAPTWAAQADAHQAHHPAGAASAPVSKSMPRKAGPDMARMDTQMKAMGEMHDKMMAAKTPEERNALMAEHMKTMQEGMAMMGTMGSTGMGGMGAVGGMQGGKPMAGNMNDRQQMMEKRMDMMQSMMQMMMDRTPAVPAK